MMNKLWGIVLLIVPFAVRAGTITGTVRAEGKAEVAGDTAGAAYDSRKFKFAERVNYAEMHDFVVYVVGTVGTNAALPDKRVQVITTKKVSQRGAMFSPHVLPVMAGTTVQWPNYDEILHNVFSLSETKPFDLDLYKAPVVKQVTFDQPGRVDVFCSIHTAMSCVVLVLENPYFAATSEKGRYVILNVPAGTYQLKAWHERLPAQVQEITVPEKGEVKADFTLGIKGLPKL
jgi:plastocyanin